MDTSRRLLIARRLVRLAKDLVNLVPNRQFGGNLKNLKNFSQITEDNVGEICRTLLPFMYSIARKNNAAPQAAEDAMQEMAGKMLADLKAGKYKDKQTNGYDSLEPYFLEMAKNFVVNQIRFDTEHGHLVQDTGNYVDKGSDFYDNMTESLEIDTKKMLDIEIVSECIKMLQKRFPKQAEILRMSYLEDMKNPEIAQKMGMTETQLEVQKSRGRQKFIELLAQHGVTGPIKSRRVKDRFADDGARIAGDDSWVDDLLSDPEVWK